MVAIICSCVLCFSCWPTTSSGRVRRNLRLAISMSGDWSWLSSSTCWALSASSSSSSSHSRLFFSSCLAASTALGLFDMPASRCGTAPETATAERWGAAERCAEPDLAAVQLECRGVCGGARLTGGDEGGAATRSSESCARSPQGESSETETGTSAACTLCCPLQPISMITRCRLLPHVHRLSTPQWRCVPPQQRCCFFLHCHCSKDSSVRHERRFGAD